MGCPSDEAMQAYIEGRSPTEACRAIDQHAHACGRCRDLIAIARTSSGEPPGQPERLARGARVGRFVVDHVLGTGGMGVVYSAHDPELDRLVALKLLREESPERRERLVREAKVLARVTHPNVCAVHDIGTHDGRLYIAMELVEGSTLRRWSGEARRSWREVVRVLAAAGRGLVAAHGVGVIHRDFKPDNVLVGADGRVRVTDFGLATWQSPAQTASPRAGGELTRSGAVLGTPLYMAPEQHAGRVADERSDQWSFAAALYEALHGQLPFAGATEAELVAAKATGRPRPAARSVPAWLDGLVRRGLLPDPAARWPSLAALVERLERRRSWRLPAAAAVVAIVGAVTAAVVVHGVRRADPDLDAARLAAQAEAMEAGLRVEHLAPLHDLRPALARLRTQVEALRPEAARTHGAASFALGKGLELLADDEGARTAYLDAWASGFRMPRVADGLGTVLARLFLREAARARKSFGGPALDARLATLQAELALPAAAYLAAGSNEPWRLAMHRGAMALLASDFAGARTRAAEARATDPGRYEALVLEAESWQAEALALHPDLPGQRAPLARALQAAEAAHRYARSDLEASLLAIEVRVALAAAPAEAGGRPELAPILSALDEAATIDPDSPRILVARAHALNVQGRATITHDPRQARASFEEAVGLLRRAADRDGGNAETLDGLAYQLEALANCLGLVGDKDAVLPAVDEGLRVLERAAAIEPRNPRTAYAACNLRDTRAWVFYDQHRKAEFFAEMRRAIAAGEEAVRLGHPYALRERVQIGRQRVHLSEDAWLSGRDPRPDGRSGLAAIEAGLGQLAGDTWAADALFVGTVNFAQNSLNVGDDPEPELDRARAVLAELERRHPDLPELARVKGWLAFRQARRLVAKGDDPGAALAEAEQALASAIAHMDMDDDRRELASVTLLRAHWEMMRGNDATAQLRLARRRIDALAGRAPDDMNGIQADAALEMALWARRSRRPAEPDARRGLAAIARVIADEPRDAIPWVTKAELEALAGDRAAARATLAHAAALNDLVRGSREFGEALALVGP